MKQLLGKKIVTLVMALVLVLSLAACSEDDTNTGTDSGDSTNTSGTTGDSGSGEGGAAESDEGKVLKIYCWNDEFQGRFENYFEAKGLIPEGVEVEWVITPSDDMAYQTKLDQDLMSQENSDEPIDIFLIEADYALKYVNTDYTLDVINDLGLTEDNVSNMYQYTKEVATDGNGDLKAVSWQATPGLFAYRRSIALDVLGTDNPDEVQAYINDWYGFNEVAEMAYDKDYQMLSGFDDSYRTFANNISQPWVVDGQIVIDDNIMDWVDQTKEFTDKGYNNRTSLWSDGWNADQGPDGNVFGFFYSTWGINFTLYGNSFETPLSEGGAAELGNGIFGDWAVTEGPESYYWGGTWLCGATGTDNPNLVRDVMYQLTCDKETMLQITLDTQDYTNNQEAMEELANSDFSADFLGGQNHIALFAAAAPNIDLSNISIYDQGMTEEFQTAFSDYFNGIATKEESLDLFYTAVIEKYPNLER